MVGLTDTDGKEFYENAGHSDDYIGYYDASAEAVADNCAKAVEVLKKYYNYDESSEKFTNVPTLEYIYNTNDGHKAIGEYLQSDCKRFIRAIVVDKGRTGWVKRFGNTSSSHAAVIAAQSGDKYALSVSGSDFAYGKRYGE